MSRSARKEYLKEVKSIFPLWTKEERNFFRQFTSQVSDFEEEMAQTEITKELLYAEIGRPDEVLTNYLSQANISYISRRIRAAKFIKLIALIVSACIIITCIIWAYIVIEEYRHFDDHQIYYEETTIE